MRISPPRIRNRVRSRVRNQDKITKNRILKRSMAELVCKLEYHQELEELATKFEELQVTFDTEFDVWDRIFRILWTHFSNRIIELNLNLNIFLFLIHDTPRGICNLRKKGIALP